MRKLQTDVSQPTFKQQVLSIILAVRQRETNKCLMIITIFFWGGKYVNYLNSVLTQWDFDFEHGNTESKCPRLNVWWTERENWHTVSSVTYTVPYVGSSVLHTAAVLAQLNLKPPGCTLTISGPYELRYCCRNWTVTARNGPDVAPHVFGLHGTWQKYTV